MKNVHRKEKIPILCTEKELQVGIKVVAIMQTITEELDDTGKRAWRKMLGISKPIHNRNEPEKNSSEGMATVKK